MAKDATECLAKMASNNADDTASDAGEMDDVLPVLEKHGEEYLKSLSQVHSLLAPHADKVVAYYDSRGRRKTKGKTDATKTPAANKVKAEGDEQKSGDGDAAEASLENHGGMYAARVEMKLAIERKEVLKDMLDVYTAEEKGV